MADRSSAAVFASIFNMLAEEPDERSKALARRIADKTSTYDFNTYQMGCDEALVKLGLARMLTQEEAEARDEEEPFLIYFDDADF